MNELVPLAGRTIFQMGKAALAHKAFWGARKLLRLESGSRSPFAFLSLLL